MYERFEQLLKAHGLKAHEVAVAVGVKASTLTRWKQGKEMPHYGTLFKLAAYFGVDVSYLLPEYK